MSEQAPGTTPEHDSTSDVPALREFAELYLAPQIMDLEKTPGSSRALVERLHRARPDLMSYVVDVFAASDDWFTRDQAVVLFRYALDHPNARTIDTLRALLHDPDSGISSAALSWVRAAGRSTSGHLDDEFRQRLHVLAMQTVAERHHEHIQALRDDPRRPS